MKPALFGVILLATSASAQLFKPVDPNQRAEVDGKSVNLPTVNFENVEQPLVPQKVSPLSHQLREPARTVETKRVETSTLSHPTVPTTTVAQQNFSAKRAVVADTIPATDSVKTPNANINKRVIRPFTPAGDQELQKQLREPH